MSDTWTRFTRFTMLSEKPPDGYTWSGEETYEETNHLKARQIMARDVENICLMHQNVNEKQKWAIEKPKLDDARR